MKVEPEDVKFLHFNGLQGCMLPTSFRQTGWFLITFGHQWSFMADSVITEDMTDFVDQFIVGFGLVS